MNRQGSLSSLCGTESGYENHIARNRLRDPAYPGKVEQVVVFTVEAWDVDCQQHIHQRFSQRQIAPVIEKLQTRIAELESEVERLRSNSSHNNEHEQGES